MIQQFVTWIVTKGLWNILFLTGFVVAMLEPLHTTKRIFCTNSGIISRLWVRAVYVAPIASFIPYHQNCSQCWSSIVGPFLTPFSGIFLQYQTPSRSDWGMLPIASPIQPGCTTSRPIIRAAGAHLVRSQASVQRMARCLLNGNLNMRQL